MINPLVNIWLNGNVPSSKNSKRLVTRGGKPRLIWSKLAMAYKRAVLPEMGAELMHWHNLISESKEPHIVCFHFVRSSKRKFDFHNACQTISDLMVEADWISDDNMDVFIPVPLQIDGRWYSIDKDAPGVIIQPGVPV
jgi:hypothetical protein